jgi:undecaprenyl-diphosphatase
MSWFEALVLGIVQGLTEYLPVSSSGHLAIGSALFGIQGEENLAFTIVVHVATVFSTLVILWKEIEWIFRGLFKFKMNAETRYVINILISMIPIGIVGVFFKDTVEAIFGSGLYVIADGCFACIFLLCQTPSEGKYLDEGCFYHRFGSGVCCGAGTLPLRNNDCDRFVIRKQ